MEVKVDNILYVHNADFSKPCANRIQVLNMCSAFKKIDQKITLMGFNCDRDIIKNLYGEYANSNLISLKPFGNYYIRSLLLFLKFLKISKVYSWIYTRDLVFAFLVSKFFKDKKVIYELHDASKDKIWYFLFRKTFNNLHCCVVISEGLKNDLIKRDFNKNKIYILHDGVDLEKFDIDISKEKARDILKLPKDEVIISYVGTTSGDRDLETFIKVAKKLENRNILFVVYGKEQDYLTKAQKKLKNFVFGDYINKPEIVYKASDILFAGYTKKVPTINYMSPLKLFEYMASKRPIIVADFPRIREIVNEEEVMFYESENIDDLASKIEKLINNRELQNKLICNAYKKVRIYGWGKRAKEIVDILKSI
jgi:glycosyltransferase involved in cell wall biosynthesis